MKEKNSGYTADFERFWSAYPFRRGSKWQAFKSFQAATRRDVRADEVIEAAERFRAVIERLGTESRYVPHATTWLNGRRWECIEDEEHAAESSRNSGGKGRTTAEELTARAVEEWIRGGDDSTQRRLSTSLFSD